MTGEKIKVLIVEDLPVAGDGLGNTLAPDPLIDVIGTTDNERTALELLTRSKPDIAAVATGLRRANAFELTRRIMESHPIPVVIVSARGQPEEVATTFAAMEAGAVAVAIKPKERGHPGHGEEARKLVQTIRAMSEVRVVRRRAGSRSTRERAAASAPPPPRSCEIRIVAVGASTGGPLALQTILGRLPRDFRAPLLIVQHIAPGFLQGLAEWLSASTSFPVHIAVVGELLLPGHAYLAPDGCQMSIGGDGRIALRPAESNQLVCPSVSHLFVSVCNAFGPRAAGVLLTGMGTDGAEELKVMREKGALTVAQDRESSVVYGMPGRAVALGAAAYVLNPEGIAELLRGAVQG